MNHNIVYLLVGPIRSGKTSALQNWIKSTPNVTGFLSPDINGKRMFLEIGSNKLIPMEVPNGNLTIGKYTFDGESFKYVEEKLIESWNENKADYIVLDEIGPLEIRRNLGFHNLLVQIQSIKKTPKHNLILVVRDYCLEEFLDKYKFSNTKTITLKELQCLGKEGL